jgi:hypothetical protein
MKKTSIIILATLFILSACKDKNNYIVPVDFSLLLPDSTEISDALTQDQQQIRTKRFIWSLRENTINHKIPDVTVFDLNGTPQRLSKYLSNTTLIISSSLTCAWDLEGLLNDFPKANKQIKNPINDKEIILLIQREDNDYFKEKFDEYIQEIKAKYANIFLIDSLMSLRLNLFGFSRYYLSKEHVVKAIGFGTALNIGYLKDELWRNTIAN